jgi:hypothetical protein
VIEKENQNLNCSPRQVSLFSSIKGLVWHEVNSLPVVELEGTVICHGIVTDITERLEAEQKLLKVNRLYSFISQINQVIVRATNEEMLLKKLVL